MGEDRRQRVIWTWHATQRKKLRFRFGKKEIRKCEEGVVPHVDYTQDARSTMGLRFRHFDIRPSKWIAVSLTPAKFKLEHVCTKHSLLPSEVSAPACRSTDETGWLCLVTCNLRVCQGRCDMAFEYVDENDDSHDSRRSARCSHLYHEGKGAEKGDQCSHGWARFRRSSS
jgi:hypothetical protein